MKKISSIWLLLGCALITLSGAVCVPTVNSPDPELASIQLPEGFQIEVFADKVKNARSMAMGSEGIIFVGTRSADNVYAVVDRDRDWKADTVYVLAEGMRSPNGVAFRDGSLYVAEINRILRWDNIESKLDHPGPPVVVNDSLPNERHHGWKYIAFGPDGKLYIPVGAPCNICERLDDQRFSSIMRMNPDGSGLEVYAHGVRNSVGFDWHPKSDELWFTENGRDWLGDDQPNDELNHAPEPGLHFGYPYCHAGDIADPQFGAQKPCSEFRAPAQKLGPHVAALGMKFYQGKMFPKEYRKSIFIAEHGSWNRSTPLGYRIMQVRLEGNRAVSYDVFAEGWLQGKKAWGRPVDILEMPDGSLLVSDDYANRIYRISYSG